MGHRKPGPLCSTRVGDEWIDNGTLCRSRSPTPGPTGTGRKDAAKEAYDKAHVYSLAPEARRKRAIDLEIIAGDYTRGVEIRIDNGDYLKKLIELASGGRYSVHNLGRHKSLQFFIIRGGAEGFLPEDLQGIDANKNVTHWTDVDHKSGETDFDENDLLAVFDAAGGFVGSARLSRPTYVQGHLSRATAKAVYNAWRNKTVFIYKNTHPGWIPYLGLAVDDGYRNAKERKHRVHIDMHKEEATNGCIFIVDPATPTDIDSSELRTFEPKLIKAILAAQGLDETKVTGNAVTLGVMRVIDITL